MAAALAAAQAAWRTQNVTVVPTGFLLAARLVVLYPLHPNRLNMVRPSPDIAALPLLDALRSVPSGLWLFVPIMYLIAVGLLWLGLRVRTAAAVAGTIILFDVLVNIAEYSNNRLLAGLVLLLIGLYDERLGDWPLRLQLSLMYAGAALNKLLDSDWIDGTFIANWTGDILDLRVYGALRERWSGADRLVSWSAIAVEAIMAVLFLMPSSTKLAVGTTLCFHVGMLVFTEGAISWLFAYVVGATLVAFTKPRHTAPYLGAAVAFWVVQYLF